MVMTHDVRKYMRGTFSPKFHHCCTKISRSQLLSQFRTITISHSIIVPMQCFHLPSCFVPFLNPSCHSSHTLSSSATACQAAKISTNNPSKPPTRHWLAPVSTPSNPPLSTAHPPTLNSASFVMSAPCTIWAREHHQRRPRNWFLGLRAHQSPLLPKTLSKSDQ